MLATMYEASGKERVIPIEPLLPEADAGAPELRILANDFEVAIAYRIAGDDDRVAVVRFDARAIYFGDPNDEAFQGHPLYRSGLRHYTFAEVVKSPWISAMEKQNRVHPSHDRAQFSSLRHFILPFHDGTFECVARRVRATITDAVDPARVLTNATLDGD